MGIIYVKRNGKNRVFYRVIADRYEEEKKATKDGLYNVADRLAVLRVFLDNSLKILAVVIKSEWRTALNENIPGVHNIMKEFESSKFCNA